MANIDAAINGDTRAYSWSTVTNADTAQAVWLPAGKYRIEVRGTFDSATVDIHSGDDSGTMAAIDTAAAPAGGRFTAHGFTNIETPGSYFKPSISGGGGSQDIDIIFKPIQYDPN